MDKPVNVLAIIDFAKPMRCDCGYANCSKNTLAAQLDAAHSVLVELIEAAQEIAACDNIIHLGRIRAALARCGVPK